jgi:hypothetical protein
MKTAVEWLEFEINRRGPKEDNPPQWLKELYKQAKEMEKEQIIEAHEEGFYSPPFRMSRRKEAEDYYNETFKPE